MEPVGWGMGCWVRHWHGWYLGEISLGFDGVVVWESWWGLGTLPVLPLGFRASCCLFSSGQGLTTVGIVKQGAAKPCGLASPSR